MTIRIITAPDEVIRLCDDIVALASAQPKALGFPPKQAYEGAIFRGSIHAAVIQERGKDAFAGHIWLGGMRPAKKVFQVVVRDDYRLNGIGKRLLQSAIKQAEKDGFYTISAKVGASLPANSFWEKQGFIKVETVRGKSTHLICNIWQMDLVPNLLTSSANLAGINNLKRSIENAKTEFSAALDTNVFIDANKEAKEALSILNRGRRGQINVLRTSATTKELRKYKGDNGALEWALQFPELNAPVDGEVVEQLREIIFPAKTTAEEQVKYDLESLAATIAAGVPIFVTADREILRKAREIYQKFSLEVLPPGDLWDEMLFGVEDGAERRTPISAMISDGFFLMENPDGAALKKSGFPDIIAGNAPSLRAALRCAGHITGAISSEPQTEPHTWKVSLYVKPGDNDEYVADTLLGWLRRKITGRRNKNTGGFLKVELTPCMGKNAARNALLSHGYISNPPGKVWLKMYAVQAVIPRYWNDFRADLSRLCGVHLPDNMPNFCRYDQPIRIAAGSTVPLNKLEDYLSSVFILPGRDSVIIPIKKWFAEDFFDHSEQNRFFSASAELLGHKSYLCTTRAQRPLQVGMPVLFYQSKDKAETGQIVAVARIVRVQIIDTDKISDAKRRHLVLASGDIKKLKNPALETVFDNCVILPSPVTLDELRKMECDHPTGYVTATGVTYRQMHKILKKGLSA